jgi:stage V sporulation protein SpoVS
MQAQVLKVSSTSNVSAVNISVLKCLRQEGVVHLDTIGMKASYNALKASIMAIDELVAEGYKTNLRPKYINVTVKENSTSSTKDKKAIRFTLVCKKQDSKK